MTAEAAPKTKLYLAGPMRGHPENNYPAFYEMAGKLREAGFEILSPAEADPDGQFLDNEQQTAIFVDYMKRDLTMVLDSDGVALLPGWEKSTGAITEMFVARMAGLPLYDAEALLNGWPHWSISTAEHTRAVAKKLGIQAWMAE